MNTIKFNKITELSTERHNPEDEQTQLVHLFSKESLSSVPLNLNILITYGCNCTCDFCILKQGVQINAISNDKYLQQLNRVLNQLKGLPIEISITGGEPTLCPERLIPVLHMIQFYEFSHRTFLTNGSGLLSEWNHKPIIQYLKEAGAIYNINLSRQHMEDVQNKTLMNGVTPSISDLKQISSFCDVNHMDIRLSCNIMKHGISDFKSMMEYIDFAEDAGFKNVIFRELLNNGNEFISIYPLIEQIKQNDDFQYVRTIENSHYSIDILKYKTYIVKLYQTQKTTKLLTNLVYREGLLSDSWKTDYFYEVTK